MHITEVDNQINTSKELITLDKYENQISLNAFCLVKLGSNVRSYIRRENILEPRGNGKVIDNQIPSITITNGVMENVWMLF